MDQHLSEAEFDFEYERIQRIHEAEHSKGQWSYDCSTQWEVAALGDDRILRETIMQWMGRITVQTRTVWTSTNAVF